MDMGCGRFSRVDIEVTVSVIIRAVSEHGAGSWISCFHLNSHINGLFYVVFVSKPTDAFLIMLGKQTYTFSLAIKSIFGES